MKPRADFVNDLTEEGTEVSEYGGMHVTACLSLYHMHERLQVVLVSITCRKVSLFFVVLFAFSFLPTTYVCYQERKS